MLTTIEFVLAIAMLVPALNVPLNQFDHIQRVFESPSSRDASYGQALPTPNPTRSFWLNSPGANPLASEGSKGSLVHDADVCIIGSGITGVSTAYHLAQVMKAKNSDRPDDAPPLNVVILEAREFCSGATGRNGGHLTPARFVDFHTVSATHGTADTLRWFALEKYNVAELLRIIEEHNLTSSVDLVSGGHHKIFFTPEELHAAKADFEAAKNAGLDLGDVQWFTSDEMQEKHGTRYPAIRHPGYNLWPLKLVTHLFQLAQQATPNLNLTLHTHTPVTSITPFHPSTASSYEANHRRWSLATSRGSITCTHVVHATNAYASALIPSLSGPSGIVPTRGQVLAVRGNPDSAPRLGRSSWYGNEGFEYWFPRPPQSEDDGDAPLVILGGGREASGPEFEFGVVDDSKVNPKVGEALRGFLPRVFPDLFEEREPEMEWTGIMGFTKTHDPFVGPVLANSSILTGQYIAAGFTGHGMTRTFACAEVVAGMIAAERDGTEWRAPDWLPRSYLTTEKR